MKKFLLLTLIICEFAFSQSLNLPEILPSPNVQNFIQYGINEVNKNNGLPSIEIPLYKIEEDGIPLNISLYRISNAINVNDVPGWTGSNWNLNAGGVIHRTKSGHLDERDDYNSDTGFYTSDGFFKSHYLLNNNDWLSKSFAENLIMPRDNNLAEKRLYRTDYEPDIFSFNFLNFSGKFFMGNDGNFKILSDQNLKIEIKKEDHKYPFNKEKLPFNNYGYTGAQVLNSVSQLKQIFKITIYDESGNQYIFGNDYNNIEYSINFFNQRNQSNWDANSWYLSEIKNRFGKSIYRFKYLREDYISKFYATIDYSSIKVTGRILGTSADCERTSTRNDYSGLLISPVYLSHIETPKGKIAFTKSKSMAKSYLQEDNHFINYYNEKALINNLHNYIYLLGNNNFSNLGALNMASNFQKLDKIQGLDKNIILNYDGEDFNMNSPNSFRLSLNSVNINDEKYKFEYDDIESLPNYLSSKIDHWGNYNGIEDKSEGSLNRWTNYETTRIADSINVKKGTLHRIIYPTKGFNVYNWEPNEYYYTLSVDKSTLINNNQNNIGAGIRIKSIDSYDIKGNKVSTQYKYNDENNFSTGILELSPVYKWEDYKIKSTNDDGLYLTFKYYTNNPVIPLTNNSGGAINYSKVKEYKQGNGYTISTFTSNFDIDYRDEMIRYEGNLTLSPYISVSDKSHLRGKPKEFSTYDENNKLLSTIQYKYKPIDNEKFIKSYDFNLYDCPNYAAKFLGIRPKKIFYNNLTVESISNIDYLDNKELKINTLYKYVKSNKYHINGFNEYVKSEEKILDDKIYKRTYNYSFEGDNIHQLNYDNFNINNIIVTSDSIINLNNQKRENISTTKIEYKKFSNDNLSYLPHIILKNKANTEFKEENRIISYNLNSIIPNQIYWNISKLYTTYLFHKNSIIAKFIGDEITLPNNKFEEIVNFFDSNTLTYNDYILNSNVLKNKINEVYDIFPNHNIETFTIIPYVGLKSKTSINRLDEYYSYLNGKLSEVKDHHKKIIKKYKYNFSQVRDLYYNEKIEMTVYGSCPTNNFSKPLKYIVPPYKYSSEISRSDANNIARENELINSQNYAEINKSCESKLCNFIKSENIQMPYTPTLSLTNRNNEINLNYTFKATSTILSNDLENNGIIIGKINRNCISTDRIQITNYLPGIMVYLTTIIETNGDVKIKAYPKNNILTDSFISNNISYDKNF